MKGFVTAALALTVFLSSVPAQAHHSFNTFWFMDKTMEIQGVVRSFKLVSPHSEMMVEVEENGKPIMWRITAKTGAVNARKEGWKPEDFIGKKDKNSGNSPPRAGAETHVAGLIPFPAGNVVCPGGCPGGPPAE